MVNLYLLHCFWKTSNPTKYTSFLVLAIAASASAEKYSALHFLGIIRKID
jgi:hypothetical protein